MEHGLALEMLMKDATRPFCNGPSGKRIATGSEALFTHPHGGNGYIERLVIHEAFAIDNSPIRQHTNLRAEESLPHCADSSSIAWVPEANHRT